MQPPDTPLATPMIALAHHKAICMCHSDDLPLGRCTQGCHALQRADLQKTHLALTGICSRGASGGMRWSSTSLKLHSSFCTASWTWKQSSVLTPALKSTQQVSATLHSPFAALDILNSLRTIKKAMQSSVLCHAGMQKMLCLPVIATGQVASQSCAIS